MKNYLKQIDINSLLLAFIITIIIPYFQKFNFTPSKDSVVLGFPFRFLTVRENLSSSFLFSFSLDVLGLILSTISFYFVIKLIKYFFYKSKE